MAQQIKITQTSNADMNIGIPKNCHNSSNNSDTKKITMAQQTAVEWFEQNISKYIHYQYDEAYEQHKEVTEIFEQAKEMEKEQIQKAFSDGQEIPMNHPTLPHYSREEYYNETFGK